MREARRDHLGKLMYYCRKNYGLNCRNWIMIGGGACPHRKRCQRLHQRLMRHEPYKTEAHNLEVEDAKKNCADCGRFDKSKKVFYLPCHVKGICPVFNKESNKENNA